MVIAAGQKLFVATFFWENHLANSFETINSQLYVDKMSCLAHICAATCLMLEM